MSTGTPTFPPWDSPNPSVRRARGVFRVNVTQKCEAMLGVTNPQRAAATGWDLETKIPPRRMRQPWERSLGCPENHVGVHLENDILALIYTPQDVPSKQNLCI